MALGTTMLRFLARRSIARPVLARGFAALAPGDDAAAEGMAAQMLEYAASLRKKGDAGYHEAMQVLEHGLSFMKSSGDSAAHALAKIQLAISSFHADQGKISDAIEALEAVSSNSSASQQVRVSALESLAGLYLQTHEDQLACAQAQTIAELGASGKNAADIQARSQAVSGLVKLSGAQFDAAASCFKTHSPGIKQGAAILTRAEVAHVMGNDEEAKSFYETAASLAKEQTDNKKDTAGVTMTPSEIHMAALAGLGQLSTDLGQFDDAEKTFTNALHAAESISGEAHARVGLVLSCMADLYTRRAKAQNSGFMIAEGLYRRSLNLLKAPPLEKDSTASIQYLDAVALTRARYGDILCSVEQRRAEGEKLKSWATAAWKNPRSLSDVLKAATPDDSSKLRSVIDLRLGRVF